MRILHGFLLIPVVPSLQYNKDPLVKHGDLCACSGLGAELEDVVVQCFVVLLVKFWFICDLDKHLEFVVKTLEMREPSS